MVEVRDQLEPGDRAGKGNNTKAVLRPGCCSALALALGQGPTQGLALTGSDSYCGITFFGA